MGTITIRRLGSVAGRGSFGKCRFKIDHPLDPANKSLQLSFVESLDVMNVSDGNVTLDVSGRAMLELPDWFEALNRDFRYQLTPIGGATPKLHVALRFGTTRSPSLAVRQG